MSTALFLTLNDIPAEADTTRRQLPEGVIAGSLRKIALENPELLEHYYGNIADINNPIVALNTLLAQDGFVLYVKQGVKIEKPLQLVNIFSNGAPLLAARRMLIIMEPDTEARLLVCDHTQNPDTDFLNLQTIEVYAAENSLLDIYDLEESSERTHRLSALYAQLESHSNVMIDGMTIFNGTTRNEYHALIKGCDAELQLMGMGIEDGERILDTYSRIAHQAPGSRSNELFKYTLDGKARGAFTGLIYVDENASKTEAYQANRNLVGCDDARMHSKPQLEIYNDDVKCSHGCAIGQLDPMQIFYMRSRGLSEAEARLLLKQAFMADVIEGVRLPMLRDRLRQIADRRFSGEEASCAECPVKCEL